MTADYHFYYPIEIRYGDIDAQRHLNNARYFTFMEQARIHYLMHLGLWQEADFDQIGIILAEQSCTYLKPITLQQRIEVGVRTERLGEKSILMRYSLRDASDHQELATGSTILVSYDYQRARSMKIPDSWRASIESFEAELESGAGGNENVKGAST